jgi:hypothetical protein
MSKSIPANKAHAELVEDLIRRLRSGGLRTERHPIDG